jgi:hypothetical protein
VCAASKRSMVDMALASSVSLLSHPVKPCHILSCFVTSNVLASIGTGRGRLLQPLEPSLQHVRCPCCCLTSRTLPYCSIYSHGADIHLRPREPLSKTLSLPCVGWPMSLQYPAFVSSIGPSRWHTFPPLSHSLTVVPSRLATPSRLSYLTSSTPYLTKP